MANDSIQRLWDRLILAVAGTDSDVSGEAERHQVAPTHRIAPAGARIRFEFYVTSDSAEITSPIATMRFKEYPEDERVFDYFRKAIVDRMNDAHAVNDFRIMSEDEIVAFVLGCHKHNIEPLPGEPNDSKGLPH